MKRIHSPEEDPSDHSPVKKPTKRTKQESVKVKKESLREGTVHNNLLYVTVYSII